MRLLLCVLLSTLCLVSAHHGSGSKSDEKSHERSGSWSSEFKDTEKVNEISYTVYNGDEKIGTVVLQLNKLGAPKTAKDFSKAMSELDKTLHLDGPMFLDRMFPQLKDDYSKKKYQKCHKKKPKHPKHRKGHKHGHHKDEDEDENNDKDNDKSAFHMNQYNEDHRNYGAGTLFLQRKKTFFISTDGNEKVCGTAVGKFEDESMPVLQKIFDLVTGNRGKRQSSSLELKDISMK